MIIGGINIVWFDVIKSISKEEIFEALGFNSNLTFLDFEEHYNWSKMKSDRTLNSLNFMNSEFVTWSLTNGNTFKAHINGRIEVGDIIVLTPHIELHKIGLLAGGHSSCETTRIFKAGVFIEICVQPPRAVQTWGDVLATMAMGYNNSRTVGILDSIPFVEWVFRIAHGKRHSWELLKDAMVLSGEVVITTDNWHDIREEYVILESEYPSSLQHDYLKGE